VKETQTLEIIDKTVNNNQTQPKICGFSSHKV